MSAEKMKDLSEAQNVWDSFSQYGAMSVLTYWYSETRGYASVSFGRIARSGGVDRRYVVRLMEELELEKDACINLGPDPEQGGRNRWKVTIDRAVAKVRREVGLADDVPCSRFPRRRVRRRPSTVVIPGSPERKRNVDHDPVENEVRSIFGGPGITTPVIPGSPPGDPRITTLVIPGSPQSSPGTSTGTQVPECTAADAGASAASPTLEFQLIGEARPGHDIDRLAKQAADARRARLYDRIRRHARWLLEHPGEAAAFNSGAAIASESDLVHATKWRCARKRIPGYGEGEVLANVCRSEWHLFQVRRAIAGSDMERGRDKRTNPHETTRGTRRKR